MARIIVVDDSEDICRLLKRALEKDGHSVTALPDTQELDEKLCKAADLILLDVMMPGEDGVAACGRIRAFTDCPILFLTARGEDEDVLNGLGAGGDDYLPSPSAFYSFGQGWRRICAGNAGCPLTGLFPAGCALTCRRKRYMPGSRS